jgi:hypothetical protein
MRLPIAKTAPNMASLGLSTGIGIAAAVAVITSPNAEQVKRIDPVDKPPSKTASDQVATSIPTVIASDSEAISAR